MTSPKSSIKIFSLCLLLCAAFSLSLAVCLEAQDKPGSPLARELQRSMSRETPLTEDDYRLYQANLDKIFALRQNPEQAREVAAAIGWSESRFAYVSTKMAVGMSMLLKPEDPRNQAVPPFAQPTDREMSIISNHRDELVKSVEALQGLQGN